MRREVVFWTIAFLAVALANPLEKTDDIVVAVPETSSTTAQGSASNLEVVTQGPLLPIEVYSVHVISEVSARYAHTVVSSRVANSASKAQEWTFSILLPETAFITGFKMELGGKVYEAYVKEKETAKKIYDEAVASGTAAAHVTAKARNSNYFTVSINVEANSKGTFNLTYEELLTRRLGVYNDIINLNPGQIIKDLTVEVHIKENRPITVLRVPELRSGNEVADETDKANEMATIQQSDDKKKATIKFSPTPEQQRQLRDIFREKMLAEKKRNNEHSLFGWRAPYEEEKTESDGGLIGQFIVQYDVEHDPQNGEILVYDGYFAHFFAPPDLKPLNKHAVFVLDISGSMSGRKIIQLREAMLYILDNLNPGDYFSIIEFDSVAKVYDLDNPSKGIIYGNQNDLPWSIRNQTVVSEGLPPPPAPVTPENIVKAKNIIKNLEARDMTNIDEALKTAMRVVNAGVLLNNVQHAETKDSSKSSEESKESSSKSKESGSEEVKEVGVTDKSLVPEPIIIFLTDGDATSGDTNSDNILRHVTELNSGKKKASIYSLAFGEGADRNLLQKLSLRNNGFLRHIYEAADAAQQLKHFYQEVSSPLLAGVKFVYPPDQVEEDSVTKNNFQVLFLGSELVVAGKLKDPNALEVSPTISAVSASGPIDYVINPVVKILPKPLKPVLIKKHYEPTERLWAYMRIKQLLDEKEKGLPQSGEGLTEKKNTEEETPEKIALALALKYSFVTSLTSLVVVKPNATSAVDAESADKIPNRPSGFHGYQGLQLSAQPHARPMYAPSASSRGPYIQSLLPDQLIAGTAASFIPPRRPSTPPSTFPPLLPPPLPTTMKPDLLAKFGLANYTWLLPYLRHLPRDELVMVINGTVVNLRLESDQNKLPLNNPPCNNSISGGSGLCKYLISCELSSQALESFESFSKYYCSMNGYAGICCPENVLPATHENV